MNQFDLSQFKSEVYAQMSARGDKYKKMIWLVKSAKVIFFSPRFRLKRGDLLESYYLLMRHMDDVADGDTPLPEGYESPADYLEAKIRFSETRTEPSDAADYLMLHCFDLASRLGFKIDNETSSIMRSMHFDAVRRLAAQKLPDSEEYGKMIIYPERKLHDHFHLLDIEGTVRGMIYVFGRDPDQLYHKIEPLGEASRIFYNLKDFPDDIREGLENISRDDMDKYDIKPEELEFMRKQFLRDREQSMAYDLEHRITTGVKNWFHDQARIGLDKIEESRRLRRNERIGLRARVTLRVVYERPAEKFFENVLATYAT